MRARVMSNILHLKHLEKKKRMCFKNNIICIQKKKKKEPKGGGIHPAPHPKWGS
jgi:hypothetical protein